MLVQDVMTKDVVQCGLDDTVAWAAQLMRARNVGCVVVTDSGVVKGIISDRDITIRCTAEHLDSHHPVRESMTAEVVTVSVGADALEVADLMASLHVQRMPVVERGRLVGLVSLSDIESGLLAPVRDILYPHASATGQRPMAA